MFAGNIHVDPTREDPVLILGWATPVITLRARSLLLANRIAFALVASVVLTGSAFASVCGGSLGGQITVIGEVFDARAIYDGPGFVLGPIDIGLGGTRIGSTAKIRVVKRLRGDVAEGPLDIRSEQLSSSGVVLRNGLFVIGLKRNADESLSTDHCSFEPLSAENIRKLEGGVFGQDDLSLAWRAADEIDRIIKTTVGALPKHDDLMRLGDLLYRVRDTERSLELWQRASEVDGIYRTELAKAYARSGMWSQAMESAQLAMDLGITDADVIHELVRLNLAYSVNGNGGSHGEREAFEGNISGLDLTGISFHGFGLKGTAIGTAFSGVFTEMDFQGDFTEASFNGSQFQDSSLRGKTAGVDFDAVRFIGGKLEVGAGISLRNAAFSHVTIEGEGQGADLAHVVMQDVVLGKDVEVSFDDASLTGAKLSSVDATGGSFRNVDMTDAEISASSFTDASFEGADMSSARVDDVIWTGARFDCLTRFPHGFNPLAQGMIGPSRC